MGIIYELPKTGIRLLLKSMDFKAGNLYFVPTNAGYMLSLKPNNILITKNVNSSINIITSTDEIIADKYFEKSTLLLDTGFVSNTFMVGGVYSPETISELIIATTIIRKKVLRVVKRLFITP